MADLTIDDVRDALPGLTFTDTSTPSVDAVEQSIADIESEITALLAGYGVEWPVEGTPAADYLRATWLVGVVARTLAAKFTLTPAGGQPASVAAQLADYNTRLGRLGTIARGILATTPGSTASGHGVPLAVSPAAAGGAGVGATSFAQYTYLRHREALAQGGWRWGDLGLVAPGFPGVPW